MGLSVKCPSRGRATAAGGTPTNARQDRGSHSWSPDPPHKYLVFNRSSAGFYRANIAGKENVDPPALQNRESAQAKGANSLRDKIGDSYVAASECVRASGNLCVPDNLRGRHGLGCCPRRTEEFLRRRGCCD